MLRSLTQPHRTLDARTKRRTVAGPTNARILGTIGSAVKRQTTWVVGPKGAHYQGLAAVTYPMHNWTGTVTHCGRICYKRRKIGWSVGEVVSKILGYLGR
jgi:hypothetical protein